MRSSGQSRVGEGAPERTEQYGGQKDEEDERRRVGSNDWHASSGPATRREIAVWRHSKRKKSVGKKSDEARRLLQKQKTRAGSRRGANQKEAAEGASSLHAPISVRTRIKSDDRTIQREEEMKESGATRDRVGTGQGRRRGAAAGQKASGWQFNLQYILCPVEEKAKDEGVSS